MPLWALVVTPALTAAVPTCDVLSPCCPQAGLGGLAFDEGQFGVFG